MTALGDDARTGHLNEGWQAVVFINESSVNAFGNFTVPMPQYIPVTGL